jgi:hypothetical protein
MDDRTISTILADNQVDPSEFRSNPSKVTVIECFQFNIPQHPSFTIFPNLDELRLLEQDIVDLDWLSGCPNLSTLILFHTSLADTRGLASAPCLKRLFLERSKLTEFPDISPLKQLELFSIAGNATLGVRLRNSPLRSPCAR